MNGDGKKRKRQNVSEVVSGTFWTCIVIEQAADTRC